MSRLSALRDETGVTLVEALVALVVSITVGLAIFAMIDFAFRQTNNVAERVNANQRGRTTLEEIVQRLHSSCVAVGASPIKEGNETEMLFLSQEGSSAVFSTMTKHRIYLENGTLYDASYVSNGGTAPNWSFPSSPTGKRVMLTNVSTNGTTPLFQYFKYVGEGELSSTPLSVPLSEEEAENTSAVTITFTAAPETTTRQGGPTRSVELTDTVLLRFDPATTAGQNNPCT